MADPDAYTLSMSKAARPGKIFIDYLRNERGATAVVAYSPRARAAHRFRFPLDWKELRKDARRQTPSTVVQRAGPSEKADS